MANIITPFESLLAKRRTPASPFWKQLGQAARLAMLTLALALPAHAQSPDSQIPAPPEPMREFRGVWIATVANIDWPSEKGLPTADAKAEMIAILDRAAELNLNAVVFQVRPTGDALYPSRLEPWSEWLTGRTGQAPSPAWDPLAFTIREARKRGIEVHAWFNPYRTKHPSNKTDPVAPALAATHPDVVKSYNNHLWMDPGEPRVQQHSLDVILDVVNRYDVAGVHLDDYFYPYPAREDGKIVSFPDDPSWSRYQQQGGRLSRDDWRRKNVNDFVQQLYAEVKAAKPHVLVGISPFGLYRPGRPEFIRGFDQYDQLYADPLLWFQQGWMDYLTPQLYWPISKPDQSFTALLRWWDEHNAADRHIWPGIATYRHFENPDRYPLDEFVHQVRWTRYLTRVSDGHIHFSMKWLMPTEERRPLAARLAETVYRDRALPPATPWLAQGDAPDAPRFGRPRITDAAVTVEIDRRSIDDGMRVVAQAYRGQRWHTALPVGDDTILTIPTPGGGELERVVVRLVDRFGRMSEPTVVER